MAINIKKIIINCSALLAMGFLLTGMPVMAEGINSLEFSPTNFVILENDLGVKKTITVTNSTSADVTLTIEECVAERVNGKVQQLEATITKSALELEATEIKIKANATGMIVTRVRISASGEEQIPCVLIKPKAVDANSDISVTSSVLIPYIIQNFRGDQRVEITADIGSSGIITSPDITIRGDIRNTGDKFFNPSGTVIISKNGVKLEEKEITSQILGLMLPGDSKSYEVSWTNTGDPLGSIGDYQIDVRISNDQTSNVAVKQLVYTYVPTDVIVLGSVVAFAIVAILIGVVVIKKK